MRLRNSLIKALLLILPVVAQAQDRYFVRFTDKNGTPFSISSPQQFLSQRALTRRATNGIAIDQSDLPVNPTYVAGVAGAGATVLNVSKWFNGAIIQTADPNVLSAIGQLSYVSSVINVGKAKTPSNVSDKFKSDEFLPVSTSNLAARMTTLDYGHGTNQLDMLGLRNLHDNGYRGTGILVAVLDAGFLNADTAYVFSSLYARNGVKATWDFNAGDALVYDDHNHGTSVLSTMASNVPGIMVGTAPDADYLLLESEYAPTENIIEEYQWSCAAEYADSAGADVINSSLGYTTFDDPAQDHTYADMDGNTCPASIAADLAAKKGIVVVVSAGNEGSSQWHHIGTPADADSVLAIGAVDSLGVYASFSSNGPSFDGRVKPDVAAQGRAAWVYNTWAFDVTPGNGTSFSGPIMAGAAACLRQAWPNRTNMEIVDAIKRSASQYNAPDTLLGYGIPNFDLANNLLSLSEYTIPQEHRLHIFPNPWNGTDAIHIFFRADSSQDVTLEITDVTGKRVAAHTRSVNGGIFNDLPLTDKLSTGWYVVSVKGKEGSFSAPVICR